MNTRSIRFQLIVWYAGLVAGCFVVLGAAAYFALDTWLTAQLKGSLARRAGLIAQLVADQDKRQHLSSVGSEIDARYAPESSDRFVRISDTRGEALYHSATPVSQRFFPDRFPRPEWPARRQGSQRFKLGGGSEMLVCSLVVDLPDHRQYLVETGGLLDDVHADLRQWLVLLLAGLPVFGLISIGGGYVLIKRVLKPVDRIAATAERIGSHNLSERLPVAKTGDELERLSITLNRMIERLDEAFQNSRRFMADASHELRTPLTILRGEMETFAQEEGLSPEMRERLGAGLEELERLVSVVEGLFSISRLDAGEAQAEWVKFDLRGLAAATADQMSLLGEDKKITINSSGNGEKVWVEGDRARMKQVVVNLLDNAIKYTPQGGEVGISVTARNGRAMLEVTDTGIGIPPDALPRVFERFYRVDEARSRELGGAGLGLSIVKSICAAHHGRVEALSTPGHGSTFRVELPLAASAAIKTNGH
jgi:heavy metal sensor kinase